MELTNDFVVDRDIDETWRILTDLEFIAPCLPGAQLTEVEGEEYRGLIKIKVGPVTASYKGRAWFLERDEAAKTARLQGEGRDPRQGQAQAVISAHMTPVGDNQTEVTIHTNLGISGKIASLGKGAVQDVSKKLLGQFTENLRVKLEDEGTAPTDAPAVEADDHDAKAATRRIDGQEAEPVDVLAVSTGAMIKRLLPAGAALAAIAVVLLNRRRRSS